MATVRTWECKRCFLQTSADHKPTDCIASLRRALAASIEAGKKQAAMITEIKGGRGEPITRTRDMYVGSALVSDFMPGDIVELTYGDHRHVRLVGRYISRGWTEKDNAWEWTELNGRRTSPVTFDRADSFKFASRPVSNPNVFRPRVQP